MNEEQLRLLESAIVERVLAWHRKAMQDPKNHKRVFKDVIYGRGTYQVFSDYKWIAQDHRGDIYAFRNKPDFSAMGWVPNAEDVRNGASQQFITRGERPADVKQSLRRI